MSVPACILSLSLFKHIRLLTCAWTAMHGRWDIVSNCCNVGQIWWRRKALHIWSIQFFVSSKITVWMLPPLDFLCKQTYELLKQSSFWPTLYVCNCCYLLNVMCRSGQWAVCLVPFLATPSVCWPPACSCYIGCGLAKSPSHFEQWQFLPPTQNLLVTAFLGHYKLLLLQLLSYRNSNVQDTFQEVF